MRGLDYPNEHYVRLYTRDSVPWAALDWEAQALYPMILRRVDRAGILDLGDELLVDALSATLPKWPPAVLERACETLIRKKFLGRNEERNWLYVPQFEEMDSASKTSAQRSREMRARRADATKRDEAGRNVPDRDDDFNPPSNDPESGDIDTSTHRDEWPHNETEGPAAGQNVPPGDDTSLNGTLGDAAGRGGTRRDDPTPTPTPTPTLKGIFRPIVGGAEVSPPPKPENCRDAFDAIWAAYPKKSGKPKAYQYWKRIEPRKRPPAKAVVDWIGDAMLTDQWQEGFIQGGSRFFNERTWEDDLEAYARANGNGAGSRHGKRGIAARRDGRRTQDLRARRLAGHDDHHPESTRPS